MTSEEALQNIRDWIEYFTRLDYVNPIVRGEVQDNFKKAYWGTLPHLKLIEKDLEVLKILKKYLVITTNLNDESEWLTFDRHIYNDDIDTEKDFYKIKEWLEKDVLEDAKRDA